LALNATHLIQEQPSNPLYRQFSPAEQTTANLSLTQPLFRGFREFAGLRLSEDLLRSEKARRVGTLALLFEQVGSVYLEILALEQDLKNLEDQREIYAARVRNLSVRSRRGETARNEPLTAQSTEAVTEAEIQLVQTRLRTARENFQLVTGLSAESLLQDPTVSSDKSPSVQKLEFYMDRLESRPDVTAAREVVSAAEESVSIAKGAHWPSLDVVGNYYLLRPKGFMDEIDWDVQFRFSLPIYEGGLRKSQTQEASSKKRESELELSRVRRSAISEVRGLHANLLIRARHLEALKRATDLSKRNSELLERDFRRGLARNIDVQASVAEYGVARRNLDQARFSARLELIRLERAANILPPLIEEAARKESL